MFYLKNNSSSDVYLSYTGLTDVVGLGSAMAFNYQSDAERYKRDVGKRLNGYKVVRG